MKRLYYLGQPGDGYGWGVANTNLVSALKRIGVDVTVDTSSRDTFDAPCFVPIGDSSLAPVRKVRKAPKTIGYCFTEWPLTDRAERNSRHYDLIFTGSKWNTDKLVAGGIKHAKTLVQGVDFARFKPVAQRSGPGFVVFSGGKMEFRKGQDYVIAAMREFMGNRKDAVLMAAWHNPWPASARSMEKSWLIDMNDPFAGLPPERVIKVPAVRNEVCPSLYAQADVGLFPNRCEAGTNLVMSEFMACERPVIASYAHGHADVLAPIGPHGPGMIATGDYDCAGWFNPPVSDILYWLEWAYQNRADLAEHAARCRAAVERFTWDGAAEKIAAEL